MKETKAAIRAIGRWKFAGIVVALSTIGLWPDGRARDAEASSHRCSDARVKIQANQPGTTLDLARADLSDCLLDGAKLTGANLSGARLDGASLVHADLSRSVRSDASRVGTDLTGADLAAADLRTATLGCVVQRREHREVRTCVDLSGANLRGAMS